MLIILCAVHLNPARRFFSLNAYSHPSYAVEGEGARVGIERFYNRVRERGKVPDTNLLSCSPNT